MFATANLTLQLGQIEFYCSVDFTVIPGEEAVRYYPDGSGYPGSPTTVDCIHSVHCVECEYPSGVVDGVVDYGWAERAERVGAFTVAERWLAAILASGSHDEQLLADAQYSEE